MNSTLTLNMSNANAGEAKPAALTTNGTWPSELPTVVYYNDKGDPLSGLPQDAGEYYAAVTVGQYVAYQSFTLHAQAIEPTNIPANRIVSNAPYGMAFSKQDIADGQYHVTVSKKNSDWNAIIAQLYDTQRAKAVWQTPHIVPYEGSTGFAYVSLTAEELATDPDAIKKAVDELQAKHKEDNISGNLTLSFMPLGSYTPENGLFVPVQNPEKFTDVLGWYKNGKLFAVELLSTMVDIDDKAEFVITANNFSSASILPATNLSGSALDAIEYAVTDGAVTYRADSSDAINASEIETTVILPQDIAGMAATCEIKYDAFKAPVTVPVETVGGKPAIRISSALPANNSAKGYGYSLIFKDAQGVYVKAYALTVTLRTGEPVPFPLYHDDWEAIPENRIQLHVTNTNGKHIPNGLGLSYDSKLGIANYEIDSNKLPRGQYLSGILGTIHITPPKGATAYKMYPEKDGGLSLRPDMYSADNDDSLNAEKRIAGSSIIKMENGIYGRSIEYPFLQGRKIDLIPNHTYTLYQLGLPSMGELGAGFRLIYWYENPDDPEPMLKEYLLVTHDPACTPTWNTPATIKEDLSSSSNKEPRIVISALDEKQKEYRFYAGIMPQTVNQELHYELYLTDQSGKEVSKDTIAALAPFTIFVPVPEDVDATDPELSFTISHLNKEGTRITESFSYEEGTLELTEFGLSFTVNSFSPFVLSWSNAAVDISALPQTGDHSPAMPMLLMALTLSLGFITLSLRKKQA